MSVEPKNRKESLIRAATIADNKGCCIELGVYQSMTLHILSDYFTGDIYGCDSFEGLPEDWREEYPAGSFKADPKPVLGTTLIVGLFQDTFPDWLPTLTKPVTLIHVDCDLYSSTIYALNAIEPYMADKVVILFDEYQGYPGWENHEHKAFTEFLDSHPRWYSEVLYEVPGFEQKCFRLHLKEQREDA